MKKFLLFVCALMVSQIAGAWYLIGAGSLGNWTPASAIASTSTEGNLEVWENVALTVNHEFKFIKEKNWNTNLGSGSSINAVGKTTSLSSNGGNCKWTGAAGTYTIKLDATNKKMYIETAKAEEIVIPEGVLSFYEGETVAFFINTVKWSKVNAYVWGDTNNNAWPGESMTVVDGVTINNKYNAYKWENTKVNAPKNIIFNNGSSQTADLVFVNGGVYDGNGTLLTTITPTVAAEPTISLHYSPSDIYTNTLVTLSATVLDGDGMTVEYFVGSDKLAANTWTPTTAGEYTLTANLMNGSEIAATDSKMVTVKENVEFSVYLDKASAWTTTYIYCWGGYGNTWPGDKLTATETVSGTEFYKWTFKNIESVNIIFTDNTGNQTADITNVSETTYYRLTGKSGNPCGHEAFDPQATPEPVVYNVTVPAGTPACYIAGEMNDWGFTAMTQVDETHYTITFDNATRSTKYKYTCGTDWAYVEVQADGNDISDRTWSENDVVAAWKATPAVPTLYAETIVKGDYYLNPGPWEVDEAWYAVYLFNKNNNPVTYTWVEGWLTNHMVIFGYTGEEAYTHMIFCRMNPAYNEMTWGDETTIRVWNQTEDIAYGTDKGAWSICNITGWEANNYEWGVIENPTALDRVETTNGITYAYGVVSAEGAIEVYNINGVVVARGNDNIDLRGLNGGVYIVRNGNQVRKVVR